MKLFLDFDGVIADTVKAVCELYREDYLLYNKYKDISPDEIDTWDFEELFFLTRHTLRNYFNTGRFFDALDVIPSFEPQFIEQLGEMYDLKICTIGDSPNIKGKKIWLSNNLTDIQCYELTSLCGEDKSTVDMSGGIIVDDNSNNLRTSNADIKICYGEEKGWNRDWTGLRCKDWKELMEILGELCRYTKEG